MDEYARLIKGISEDDSPGKKPLLVVANEVSGTTTIYEITPLKIKGK